MFNQIDVSVVVTSEVGVLGLVKMLVRHVFGRRLVTALSTFSDVSVFVLGHHYLCSQDVMIKIGFLPVFVRQLRF